MPSIVQVLAERHQMTVRALAEAGGIDRLDDDGKQAGALLARRLGDQLLCPVAEAADAGTRSRR